MRMLDLFCGRLGWSKAFLARGWECVGVDLVEPAEIPPNFEFVKEDALNLAWERYGLTSQQKILGDFDFICASPPCQQFSIYGMPHFHPEPKFPELGLALFNHTRSLCHKAKKPHVIENVHDAERFVGMSTNHCGPFYLWGNAIPAIFPAEVYRIQKQMGSLGGQHYRNLTREELREFRRNNKDNGSGKSAKAAEIPPELANCVADYAERLLLTTTDVAGSSGQTDPVDRNSGDGS